jgi:DNA-binding response OmpR family regulator
MRRVLLLHQTEGGAVMRNDLAALDVEVDLAPLADADVAMSRPDFDAVVVEVAANVEETRRVLESPARQPRTAMLLLVRVEQLPSVDAAWPIDDFVVLPAATSELALRIRRAVFQKTGLDSDNLLACGDLLVDMANYKVFVDEQPVSLTFKEFELLRFLMTNRGKVFTREALLNRVWGYEYFGGARTVDVHIRRLRSKIETGATVYIETVRNVGYRFPSDQR